MGCSIRTNRHGFLAFRLYWQGRESHEGTKLLDTPENRAKVEARAKVIAQEMADGTFDYVRWFPEGNLAHLFRPASADPRAKKVITVRGFFERWGQTSDGEPPEGADLKTKQGRTVSAKWAINRASTIKSNVLPSLGPVRLDEITAAHLTELQRKLRAKGLKPATVDGAIHSALRAMLRDARSAGYLVPDLGGLYAREEIQRIDPGRDATDIDPFSEDERDRLIEYFCSQRRHYYPFVMHQFWTGARPSEAIHLRRHHLDLDRRQIMIRGSRVLGQDSSTKTKNSGRNVVIHGPLLAVLRAHQPLHPKPSDFVFTTPNGSPIDEANFYGREWVRALRATNVRPRGFYNCRHTYISYMKSIGVDLVFIARQTGTSLEMILKHYGSARVVAEELDELIESAGHVDRNPTGTLSNPREQLRTEGAKKAPSVQVVARKAGDRGRTGDVQLGKLAFYR